MIYFTCGPKLYRPIWLWAEIDMGRNCYGPKCPVTAKLCQGGEQDSAGWEGAPVYDSSAFTVVCRGGILLVLQRVDEFREFIEVFL